MAKVLFVINVPTEDNAKQEKLKRGPENDSKDNELKEKIKDIGGEADLVSPNVMFAPGTHGVETADSRSYETSGHVSKGDTGQGSTKKVNFVDEKKTEAELRQPNSGGKINEKEVRQNGDIDELDGLKKTDNGKDEDLDIEYIRFISDGLTLLNRVKRALDSLDIPAVNWSQTKDGFHVGMFISGDGERCEEILQKLTMLDLGVIPGSSISVFPASVSIASVAKEDQTEKLKLELEKEDKLAEKVSEFKKSIKSRLLVAQVVDSVKSDAIFTFDYLMLVILASMVAIMGLLENSPVALVASMLISPLMGPIISFVFGAEIKNKELLRVGISSETKGLALCIIVGFISGLIPAGLESAGLTWRTADRWPTPEMSARGGFRSLPIGILIAIPSGAGVALSILGGKVGSLVGVAISASLLPPAVNAGLLWANAVIVGFIPPQTETNMNSSVLTGAGTHHKSVLGCHNVVNNKHEHVYSCNMAVESVVLGVISLLLTIVNIICIIFMGVIVLKIKEVAPIRLAPDAEKDFFAKDLKVARESYETTKGPNSTILGKKFLLEYRKFKQEIGVEDSKRTHDELNEILEDVEEAEDVKEILDKLPHRPKRWSSYVDDRQGFFGNPYHTFHGASYRPASPGTRKRASGVVSISPTKSDDNRHNSVYLTTHNFFPTNDAFHSPLVSHRSPGRYFTKKSKSRFQVAKVEEDGNDAPKVLGSHNSPSKVEILSVINEAVPLLNVAPKEI